MKGRTFLVMGLLAVTSAVLECSPARAQFGFPGGGVAGAPVRPTVSPYLNLLRQGNPAFMNYYGLVRPQQTAINALNGLQQQVNTNTTALTAGTANELSTGHTFGFMTHRMYFMNLGGGAGGRGGVGGGMGGYGGGMGGGMPGGIRAPTQNSGNAGGRR